APSSLSARSWPRACAVCRGRGRMGCRGMSRLRSRGVRPFGEVVDEGPGAAPLRALDVELLETECGQLVVGAGLARGRDVLVAVQQALGLHALDRGVEGRLLDDVLAPRTVRDRLGELVRVRGAGFEDRQQDQVDVPTDGIGSDHHGSLPLVMVRVRAPYNVLRVP